MTPALRLSVAVNVVLAGTVGALLLWPDPAPVPAPPLPAPAARAVSAVAGPVAAPAAPSQGAASETRAVGVTPAAVAQLEQMGISREVLVNAVLGEFHRRWDARFTELERKHAPAPVPEREYIELARQRDAERVAALQQALGEERHLAWDQEQTLRLLNVGGVALNPDEAARAYRLQKEFDERARELEMALEDGFADGVDVNALHAQARETLDQELATLLGRERFARLRGVSDPAADVQRRYGALHPTPDQTQAILRADDDFRAREAALSERLKDNPAEAAHLTAALQALHEAREEQRREIFGAEAYETMQRQHDPAFQRLNQFAVAWELGEDDIRSVYEHLRVFRDQAELARNAAAMREAAGQPVNWTEVNAAIDQARQQTEAGLQSLLGAQRLWRLQQDGLLKMR